MSGIFAKVQETIAKATGEALGLDRGAPPSKAPKAGAGSTAKRPGSQDAECKVSDHFTEPQVACLQAGITASLNASISAFSSAVETHVADVKLELETKIDTAENNMNERVERKHREQSETIKKTNDTVHANKVASEVKLAEIDKKYLQDQDNLRKEMQVENEKLRALITSGLAGHAGANSSGQQAIPANGRPPASDFATRTKACMGNLAWDEQPHRLIERAEALLTELQYKKPDDYVDIFCPSRTPTSFVHVNFANRAALDKCNRDIAKLERKAIVDQPDKLIFCVTAKTREERAPTRRLRSAAKFIKELEAGSEKEPKLTEIEAHPQERVVRAKKTGGARIILVYLNGSDRLVFTAALQEKFSDEELQIVLCASQ